MPIVDPAKVDMKKLNEFVKNGGLMQSAKAEKEIMQKAFTKEELKEKRNKK
jgi:hypothetical protein